MTRGYAPCIARQAMRVLLNAYTRLGGQAALDICRAPDIEIRRTLDDPKNARIIYPSGSENRKWIILLPKQELSDAMRDFLIFHEIAHAFLYAHKVALPLGSEQYWELEVWCDLFAIAMLFAGTGYDLVRGDPEFFCDPEMVEKVSKAKLDLLTGEKLRSLCEQAKGVETGLFEQLAGELIARARIAEASDQA